MYARSVLSQLASANIVDENDKYYDESALLTSINASFCPKPLIWYTEGPTNDRMACIESCCLPCPYVDNFYPDGEIDSAYRLFAIFGITSFFLMIILSMIFLLLPSQKNNPTVKKIILPLVLSVCYFEFSEFFTIQRHKILVRFVYYIFIYLYIPYFYTYTFLLILPISHILCSALVLYRIQTYMTIIYVQHKVKCLFNFC